MLGLHYIIYVNVVRISTPHLSYKSYVLQVRGQAFSFLWLINYVLSVRRLFFSEFVYNSFVKPWTKYLFCWTKAELFVFLFLFFWPLYCLSFVELRLLITPLLSSNCSYVKQQTSNHSFSPKNSFPLRLGPSWSYDSWIYNNICNQCISPLTLWVRISLRRYNIMW